MKTSRSQRLEEWRLLRLDSINGRLLVWSEIKRWKQLRQEFAGLAKDRVNESKAFEKV